MVSRRQYPRRCGRFYRGTKPRAQARGDRVHDAESAHFRSHAVSSWTSLQSRGVFHEHRAGKYPVGTLVCGVFGETRAALFYAFGCGLFLGMPFVLGIVFSVGFGTLEPLALLLPFVMVFILVLLFRPTGYRLDENYITVTRPIGGNRFSIAEVGEIRPHANSHPALRSAALAWMDFTGYLEPSGIDHGASTTCMSPTRVASYRSCFAIAVDCFCRRATQKDSCQHSRPESSDGI